MIFTCAVTKMGPLAFLPNIESRQHAGPLGWEEEEAGHSEPLHITVLSCGGFSSGRDPPEELPPPGWCRRSLRRTCAPLPKARGVAVPQPRVHVHGSGQGRAMARGWASPSDCSAWSPRCSFLGWQRPGTGCCNVATAFWRWSKFGCWDMSRTVPAGYETREWCQTHYVYGRDVAAGTQPLPGADSASSGGAGSRPLGGETWGVSVWQGRPVAGIQRAQGYLSLNHGLRVGACSRYIKKSKRVKNEGFCVFILFSCVGTPLALGPRFTCFVFSIPIRVVLWDLSNCSHMGFRTVQLIILSIFTKINSKLVVCPMALNVCFFC